MQDADVARVPARQRRELEQARRVARGDDLGPSGALLVEAVEPHAARDLRLDRGEDSAEAAALVANERHDLDAGESREQRPHGILAGRSAIARAPEEQLARAPEA